MKISIKNFAKIKEADIIIDAITVIAGPNNSGKSTIGKALDTVFFSSENIKEKMNRSRYNNILNVITRVLDSSGIQDSSIDYLPVEIEYKGYIKGFETGMSSEQITHRVEEVIDDICRIYFHEINEERYSSIRLDMINEMSKAIQSVTDIPDEVFEKRIMTSQFNDVFNGDINNKTVKSNAEIVVTIKDKRLIIGFSNGNCYHFTSEVSINNHSHYIENPFVIDKLNINGVRNFISKVFMTSQERRLLLELAGKTDNDSDNVLREIITDNRTQKITDVLNRVVPGNIKYNQKYEYILPGRGALDVRSLSTGLKSFAIIKRLLEVGNLNDKDVIILDEPEIHLHPEWQHLYAELVVLLQKNYNFHILVTTHSSKFLEAIEFYSKKHGIDKKTNYYLAGFVENDMSVFKNVTGKTETIYKQMIDPSIRLEKEEYEWETRLEDE